MMQNGYRVQVPNFSKAALDLADLCAREQWRNKSYDKGLQLRTAKGNLSGDEHLLNIFGVPFLNKAFNIKGGNLITSAHIDDLISATKITVVKTKQSNLDFNAGIKHLMNTTLNYYKIWKKSDRPVKYADIGVEITRELSNAIFKTSPQRQVGNHVALASRLLFFAIPNLPLFNFSTPIALGLKLSGDSYVKLDSYVEQMQDGLNRNWHLLSEYQMPLNNIISDRIWMEARDNGWWQRRIYDLALKFHYVDRKNKKPQVFNKTILKLYSTKPHAYI